MRCFTQSVCFWVSSSNLAWVMEFIQSLSNIPSLFKICSSRDQSEILRSSVAVHVKSSQPDKLLALSSSSLFAFCSAGIHCVFSVCVGKLRFFNVVFVDFWPQQQTGPQWNGVVAAVCCNSIFYMLSYPSFNLMQNRLMVLCAPVTALLCWVHWFWVSHNEFVLFYPLLQESLTCLRTLLLLLL